MQSCLNVRIILFDVFPSLSGALTDEHSFLKLLTHILLCVCVFFLILKMIFGEFIIEVV